VNLRDTFARRIADRQHKIPTVLMGDFNADESSQPMNYLTGRTPGGPLLLADSFRAAKPGAKHLGTFGGFFRTCLRRENRLHFHFIPRSMPSSSRCSFYRRRY
jgi:hypothetical protein